ncbi:WhiB family transcriptional regulator [Rhodococcus jostii]|uniref:WhiB family transcriptional regulator n=1 Tax=Rhodococcus jostii TaxID=132919 RepID=UPI003981BEDC
MVNRAQRGKQTICRACPVLQKCRDYAVAANEPHGIWGGLSPPNACNANGNNRFYAA